MNINRGLVFWGVALITAGAVALAIQSGAIAGEQIREVWRFWPVALIAVGVAIMLARTPVALIGTLVAGIIVGGLGGSLFGGWPDAISFGCGGTADQQVTQDGTFGPSASVELDFDCGELDVGMADGDGWSVDARYAGDRQPRIVSGADSLRVDVEGGFPFGNQRQEWTVTLPRDAAIDLEVEANASSSTLDLTDGRFGEITIDANAGSVNADLSGAEIDSLDLDGNAGSFSMVADADTVLTASLEYNAGSVEVCVPDGVALAITLQDTNVTFSHNLDDRGLTRSGDTWRSGTGDADITLNVSGNAASFTLNPEGGCQ